MNFYSKQLARDLVCENSSIYIVCLFRLILLLICHQQTVVEQLMQHIKWEAITLPGCMDSRKVIGPDSFYRFETCCEMLLTYSTIHFEDRRKAMKYLMKAKEIHTSANDSMLSDSELLNLDKYLRSASGSRTEPDQESVVSESTNGMMSTPGNGSTIGTHSTSLLSSSSSAMP